MTQKHTSFIMYHSFATPFDALSMEQKGELINAIFDYERYGALKAPLSDIVNMAFICIKDTLDRDRLAYEEKCKTNSDNGKKGGRPKKKSFSEKTERLSEKTKKAYTDTYTDTDTDTDTYTDTDTKTENNLNNSITPPPEELRSRLVATESQQAPLSPACDVSDRHSVLNKNQIKYLIEKGVPRQYFEQRADRAAEHAARVNKEITEVLLEWFERDQKSIPKDWGKSEYKKQASVRDSVHTRTPEKDEFTKDWFDKLIAQWGEDG